MRLKSEHYKLRLAIAERNVHKMYNWLDLHMHSAVSNDGEFTPEQLMQKCFEKKLRVVSLADHNSVRGIKDARSMANKLEIEFIPGVELDCQWCGYNLHLLCYGIDENNDFFNQIEVDVERQEQCASHTRVELVKKANIFVDEEKVKKLAIRGVITGEMIAEVVLHDAKNNDNHLLKPYRHGENRSDNPYVNFYWDFCSQGKVAYVPINFIKLSEAVKHIKAMGGITILAHPYINIGKDLAVFEKILACGIDGVEAYSSYHDDETTKFYIKQAQDHSLLISAGSDFHGKIKPAIDLGNMQIEDQSELLLNIRAKLKDVKEK